jgi:hypothetical protein
MTRYFNRKLNHFLVSAPSGVVLTSEWLEEQGISSKLAWWYVHSGLLERLAVKAYKKPGERISWAGGVTALQNQLHLPIHVGGKTALQLLGRAHFVPVQGPNAIQLFTNLTTRAPSWFGKEFLCDTDFRIFKTSLFAGDRQSSGIIDKTINSVAIQLSCPERAALELLYLCPKYESLNEVSLTFENLGQLRPTVVQSLLEACNSIKVKRLFLYFADKFQHTWRADLDLKKINLGSGKRVILTGGKYDPTYQIALPSMEEKE